MRFKELPKRWKTKIIALSSISVLFLILLAGFNLFLHSYRAENERQRAKLVKDDSELIGERIEIPRDGTASVKAKRSYGLNRVMAHLPETSFCVIGIALLCMNLAKRLRSLLLQFLRIWFLTAPSPAQPHFRFLGACGVNSK